ncbi:sporulation protein [Ectobacillus funiculus]|uniref:sporulation protein n=1 Tax=Ectobacillus funiculus TaxID=137993 RepID=UPI00101D6223|nr:sporulation protein [Ectobacillus funiculus]
MILRKSMSLLGIGSAQIDLVLLKKTYRPDEYINGHFLIKGGTVEQQIKRIECDLAMINHSTGLEQIIDTTIILTSRLIYSEESNKLPFTFKLPAFMPISSKEISYCFRTKLTFDEGVQSKDQDTIQIIQ